MSTLIWSGLRVKNFRQFLTHNSPIDAIGCYIRRPGQTSTVEPDHSPRTTEQSIANVREATPRRSSLSRWDHDDPFPFHRDIPNLWWVTEFLTLGWHSLEPRGEVFHLISDPWGSHPETKFRWRVFEPRHRWGR